MRSGTEFLWEIGRGIAFNEARKDGRPDVVAMESVFGDATINNPSNRGAHLTTSSVESRAPSAHCSGRAHNLDNSHTRGNTPTCKRVQSFTAQSSHPSPIETTCVNSCSPNIHPVHKTHHCVHNSCRRFLSTLPVDTSTISSPTFFQHKPPVLHIHTSHQHPSVHRADQFLTLSGIPSQTVFAPVVNKNVFPVAL